MSATLRSASPLVDNSTAQIGSVDFTIPAGAAVGDIVLFGLSQNTGVETFTPPAGWTSLAGPLVTASNLNTQVFVKKLVGGDPGSTVTFTASGGGRMTAAYQVIQNVDAVSEIVVASATGTALAASPTVTTTEADCFLSTFWFVRAATTVPVNITPGANSTEDAESNTNFGTSPNLAVAANHRTANTGAAGSYGGHTITTDQVISHYHVYTIAVTTGAASNVAPTANAGADQTGVEPGATVTLTGTVADTDGTATGAWTQTAGSPAVTLAGSGLTRTFSAPLTMSGTTLTFALAATDNLGATGTDTMTVAVLPASELVNIGGTWMPARLTVV